MKSRSSRATSANFGLAARSSRVSPWTRVAPQLDDYAARWRAAHADACEATHVRHEQPEALMDARMSCLEDRRRGLRALVRALEEADAAVVERAVSAVGALPPIEPCADPDYVRAQALPRQAQIGDLALQRYNAMLIGTYDLLEIRTEGIEVEQHAVEAVRAYWEARAELELAAGGRLDG